MTEVQQLMLHLLLLAASYCTTCRRCNH